MNIEKIIFMCISNPCLKKSSPAMSQPSKGSLVPPNGVHMPRNLTQGHNDLYQVQKKARFDAKPDDVIQQLQQQGNNIQFQGHNSESMDHYQQRLLQQQQLQIMQWQKLQQARLQHQQLQLYMQQQSKKNFYDGSFYTRRLLEYMHHQRTRPPDNNIAYWRTFVAEYYAPLAKKRWCFSLCNDMIDCALGVCTDEAKGAWHCDICCSTSGSGFEANYETLPKLLHMKFASGVIDELLYIDLPRGHKLPSGVFILDYEKAVLHSVYKQSRAVHEGILRVAFSDRLKILSWEFCVRHHEEFVPRSLLKTVVNNLIEVSERCQTPHVGNESNENLENLQTKSQMLYDAASVVVNNLDCLGFSETYIRRYKLSEVADSMRDLVDFSIQNKSGPIASLQNFSGSQGLSTIPDIPNNVTNQVQCSRGNANANQVQNIGEDANVIIGDGVASCSNLNSSAMCVLDVTGGSAPNESDRSASSNENQSAL